MRGMVSTIGAQTAASALRLEGFAFRLSNLCKSKNHTMRTKVSSPFARLQLFRNPFGELTVAERAELAVIDTERYLQWLTHSPRAALQVIGPCGHGKSTHLRALQAAWFARQPSAASGELPALVYFPEEGDQPALPARDHCSWMKRSACVGGAVDSCSVARGRSYSAPIAT